jgi:hypothetical protein
MTFKKVATAIASLVPLIATANSNTIDFAYPKDVSINAEQAFKQAKNGVDRLEALMLITYADWSIDKASAQQSIERVIKQADKEKDPAVKSLMNLFAANIYEQVLGSNYQYNSRDIPDYPRPADITEWSRNMFVSAIDSLSTKSWNESSADMSIDNFAKLTTVNDYTKRLFTNQRDFVAGYIITNNTISEDVRKIVIEAMLNEYPENTAKGVVWRMLSFSQKEGFVDIFTTPTKNTPEKWLTEVYNNADNDDVREIALYYLSNTSPESVYQCFGAEQYKLALEKFVEKKTVFEDNFKKALSILNRCEVQMYINEYIVANKPCKMNCTFSNVDTVKLNCYLMKNGEELKSSAKLPSMPDLIFEEAVNAGMYPPVKREISIKLPTGLWLIVPDIKGKDISADNGKYIYSLNALPIVLNGEKKSTILVVDPANASPIKGAAVSLDSRNIGVTDSNGMVACSSSKATYPTVQYQGNKVTFDNVMCMNRKYNATNPTPTISISTSQAVYHPGDTVKFVGVVTKNGTTLSGYELNVAMLNTQRKSVDSKTFTSDELGRIVGQFVIPTDTRTGTFYIDSRIGSKRFTVSDFTLAEMQVLDLVAWPCTPQKGICTIRGRVVSYSGMPMAGVNIEAVNSDNNATSTATTDANGNFEITLSTISSESDEDATSAAYDNEMGLGMFADVDLTFTSPSGYSISKSVYFDTEHPNTAQIKLPSNNENIATNKPIKLDVTILTPAKEDVKTMIEWRLVNVYDDEAEEKTKPVASGSCSSEDVTVDWSKVPAGDYTLIVKILDNSAEPAFKHVTLYNPDIAKLPNEDALWSPNTNIKAVNGRARLTLGVNAPVKCIYLYRVDDSSETPAIEAREIKAGWYDLEIETNNCSEIVIFSVTDCVVSRLSFNITEDKTSTESLKVAIESFRDNITSGSNESWSVAVTDNGEPVKSAVVVNVYNLQLDALAPYSPLNVNFAKYVAPKFLNLNYAYVSNRWLSYYDKVYNGKKSFYLKAPKWSTFGCTTWDTKSTPSVVRLYSRISAAENVSIRGYATSVGGGNLDVSFEAAESSAEDSAVKLEADTGDTGVIWRDDEQISALWLPNLTTDANGLAIVDFTAPATNSTWRTVATAWTSDGRTASFDKTFTTSKPIMVDSNLPRILRQGDSITINSTIYNKSDREQNARVSVAIYNAADTTLLTEVSNNVLLAPMGSTVMPINFDVPLDDNLATILYRVKASIDGFADGEQGTVDILPSQTQVVDAYNFYIPASQATYTHDIPKPESYARDFHTSLYLTANPMATVVEALPSLFKTDYSTSIAQATTYFGSAVALALIEQHPEINFNIDKQQITKIRNTALTELLKLQDKNGGFRWSPWSTEANQWVTESVLQYFSWLNRNNMLDSDSRAKNMVESAIEYADSNVKDNDTDMFFTEIRLGFPETKPSLKAQKVIDNTVQYIVKNWRKFDIDSKAQGATILAYNRTTSTAKEILKSMTQYATITPDKGMVFKNNPCLFTYTWALQAYAIVSPKATEVDALRQQLIIRKQATDWGNLAITSAVIATMVNSGTKWYDVNPDVKVLVDGQRQSDIQLSGTSAAVENAPISGSMLTIERASDSPAYGSIVASYSAQGQDVKAFSDGEISIVKSMFVQRDGKWTNVNDGTGLNVGDRVKVQLCVKTERSFNYLTITDNRPAAFEPVNQLPCRVFVDGLFAYMEPRDRATNIYINSMSPGTWLVSYEVYCGFAGTFASGIATITSDMAPTLTAHSAGNTVAINKKIE